MHQYQKITASFVLGGGWFLILPGKSATQVKVSVDEQQKHEAWLWDRLSEAESIKAGMTRADLLKVFEEDGGLQRGASSGRFVLRSCHLIKVNVKFELGDP